MKDSVDFEINSEDLKLESILIPPSMVYREIDNPKLVMKGETLVQINESQLDGLIKRSYLLAVVVQ